MGHVDDDNTTTNYDGEFRLPSHQYTGRHDDIETVRKDIIDLDNMNRKLTMDYNRKYEYNLGIIQHLKAEITKCHKKAEEIERANATSWKEIENIRNENLVLREVYEKLKKENVEMDLEILATKERSDNHISEMISKQEQSWKDIVKGFGIDHLDWDELWSDTKEMEILIGAITVYTSEIQTLHLEHEEKMSHDGDSPTTVAIIETENNLPSTSEPFKKMREEFHDVVISDD